MYDIVYPIPYNKKYPDAPMVAQKIKNKPIVRINQPNDFMSS